MLKNSIIWMFVISAALSVLEAQTILNEKFASSTAELKRQGWTVPKGCKIIKGRDGKCLEVSSRMIRLMLKVAPGGRYTVRCRIKTENVKFKPKQRGATIFAQLHDKNKAYMPGGTFPKGLSGTNDWQEFVIPFTSLVTDSAAYLNIFVGIEGRGKAWFKDLRIDLFKDYQPIEIISPAQAAEININQPEFEWKSIDRKNQLVIAADKGMSKNRKAFNVGKASSFQLPRALPPGKWYWQVEETSRAALVNNVHRSVVRSFTIAADAVQWPVRVEEFSYSGRQALFQAKVCGPDDLKTEITIDKRLAEIISFKNKILRFKPSQKLTPGLHEIIFNFTGKKGKKCQVKDFYNSNIPSSKVTWHEGITYIDGKAFFPVGAYRDPSDKLLEFSGLKEAGFNMTHSYAFESSSPSPDIIEKAREYLDAADKNGLKVFLGISRKWIKDFNAQKTAAYIAALNGRKALLTWYLADEPIAQKKNYNNLYKTNKLVKQLDPFHPTFIVFAAAMASRSQLVAKYCKAVDIIGSDPYPVHNGRGSYLTVERWIENGRYQAGKNRPVWCVIEAFDNDYIRGHKKYQKFQKSDPVVKPGYNELKNQCFMALSAGADGIIFYWLPCKRYYNIREDAPAVWQSICRVVKELHAVESFMTTPRSRTKLSFKVPGPFRVWIRSNAKGETAVAFINPLNKARNLKLKLPLNGRKLYSDGKITRLNNGLYESSFSPYETKVYIIK